MNYTLTIDIFFTFSALVHKAQLRVKRHSIPDAAHTINLLNLIIGMLFYWSLLLNKSADAGKPVEGMHRTLPCPVACLVNLI